MILVNTQTGRGIAAIPSNGNWSLGEWLEDQDIQIIHDKSDPRWSNEGDNIIINGSRCRPEDLAIVNQTVSDLDLAIMFNEALTFYDPQSYYEANYMAAYGPDSPDTYADNMCSSECFRGVFDLDPKLRGKLFDQFLILFSIAHDPFKFLLKRMRMTPQECACRFAIDGETMQEWIFKDSAPSYVRLMMAESTGVLKLRNFNYPPNFLIRREVRSNPKTGAAP